MAYTITEALQELKTIQKRLQGKCTAVGEHLGRDARIKDPLEKEGGSVEFIKRERQAISDLEQRVVVIRTAIQKKNLEVSVSVNGATRTVAEWLTWRREVSEGRRTLLRTLSDGIKNARLQCMAKGGRLAPESDAAPGDIIVHLDEQALVKEMDELEITLGELDGKLSLINATTVIDV